MGILLADDLSTPFPLAIPSSKAYNLLSAFLCSSHSGDTLSHKAFSSCADLAALSSPCALLYVP